MIFLGVSLYSLFSFKVNNALCLLGMPSITRIIAEIATFRCPMTQTKRGLKLEILIFYLCVDCRFSKIWSHTYNSYIAMHIIARYIIAYDSAIYIYTPIAINQLIIMICKRLRRQSNLRAMIVIEDYLGCQSYTVSLECFMSTIGSLIIKLHKQFYRHAYKNCRPCQLQVYSQL